MLFLVRADKYFIFPRSKNRYLVNSSSALTLLVLKRKTYFYRCIDEELYVNEFDNFYFNLDFQNYFLKKDMS